MGTAAARALSTRGRAVILLERSTLAHAGGSTAGTTRNFRLTYHDPSTSGWRGARWSDGGSWRTRPAWSCCARWAASTWARRPRRRHEPSSTPASASSARRTPRSRSAGPCSASRPARPSCTSPTGRSCAPTRRFEPSHDWRPRTAPRFGRRRRRNRSPRVATAWRWRRRRARSGRRWRSWRPARGPARSWGGRGIPLTLRPTLEQSTYFDADAADLPTVIDWDEAPEQPPYIVPDPFEPGTIKAGAHLSGPVVDPDTRSFEPDEARELQVVDWVGRRLVSGARPSAPRRASTRGRPTRTSSSIGSDRSCWRPRAAVTASSSHRSSARCWRISSPGRRPRSPWNGSEPIGRPSEAEAAHAVSSSLSRRRSSASRNPS